MRPFNSEKPQDGTFNGNSTVIIDVTLDWRDNRLREFSAGNNLIAIEVEFGHSYSKFVIFRDKTGSNVDLTLKNFKLFQRDIGCHMDNSFFL